MGTKIPLFSRKPALQRNSHTHRERCIQKGVLCNAGAATAASARINEITVSHIARDASSLYLYTYTYAICTCSKLAYKPARAWANPIFAGNALTCMYVYSVGNWRACEPHGDRNICPVSSWYYTYLCWSLLLSTLSVSHAR